VADRLVLQAVRNQKAISKQGLLQSLFAAWFDAFVYNQIWEDPLVDIESLQLDRDSRILTISSGGCNALNYLIEDSTSVTAVDLNRHHIYLLNLKIAAIKGLSDYEDFYAMFGLGTHANNGTNYLRFIRPHLDVKTRDYWESNSLFGGLIHGDRISLFTNAGLYDHSRNGYFLRLFHKLAHIHGYQPEKLLTAENMAEQEDIYQKEIEPFFSTLLIRLIGKLPVTGFGLGIPPQQYDELKQELGENRSIVDLYQDRVRRLACEFPIADNYFAWQAFARRYDTKERRAIPEYLKEQNFASLRDKIHRINTRIGSVTDAIGEHPPGSFDRFVFLDAQDWMTPDQIIDLWGVIAKKAAPGSRIIFRTAGSASPLERVLPNDLLSKFRYEREISEMLFQKDRSSIYGGFHLYVLKD
jgi:S-adenosylmethionine-diacylglycerol 3-amino-3-carboxypropyl transferase